MADQKTEELLKNYSNLVTKNARECYIKANALKREIEELKINNEDRLNILMYSINILTGTPKNNR